MSNWEHEVEALVGHSFDLENGSYYELLGIGELEPNSARIEKALKELAQQLKEKKGKASKESWNRVVSVYQQAKRILSSPDAKLEYDNELRKRLATISHASTSLFPMSDPNAPFDMAEYIQLQGPSLDEAPSSAQRVNRLLEELRLPTTIWEEDSAESQVVQPRVGTVHAEDAAIVARQINRVTPATRKKKGGNGLSSTAMLGGGLVVISMLIVAAGLSMFLYSQWRKPAEVAQGGAKERGVEKSKEKGKESKPNRTFDVEATKFDVDVNSKTIDSGSLGVEDRVPEPKNQSPLAMENLAEPTMVSEEKGEKKPAEAADSKPASANAGRDPGRMPSMEPNDPTPKNNQPAPLSLQEKEKIVDLMKKTRSAIDRYDFEDFERLLAQLLPLARQQPFTDQAARLDQLGQLKRIYLEAVKESVRKLASGTGGESFKVMNTFVSFIEGNDETISIKVGGAMQKHRLKELPLGVGLGLADLSLDSEAGTDLAARAVFCLTLPKQNGISREQGRKYLEKAAQTGKIRSDLSQVFDDVYKVD